jgi:hypothetical protein
VLFHPGRALVTVGLVVGALGIAACASSPTPAAGLPEAEPAEAAVATAVMPSATVAGAVSPSQDLARLDAQGAVEVVVRPSSWTRDPQGTLEFEVSMNTHSVELSMDLAKLATLQTDTGHTLQALDWSGGGGHHVTGVLRFPSSTLDGQPLLDGAWLLTLTIQDLDAPSRSFQWEITSLP